MSAAAVQPKPPAAGKQLEWVNPPQQARSQQTLDRLLDAAEALIEERGFEEISVAEITRKARSSVGAFYSRFKDKQGLLRYVQQRFSEQAAATAEVALSPDRWAGMSVYENLVLGRLALSGRNETYDLSDIFRLFPVLEERRNQQAGTLSGGQQQMLAIGRALMGSPRMLLLDEPSLGLAPVIVKGLFHALRSLNESGMTILLVEQNARLALAVSQRAYILERGRVAHHGRSREIASNSEVIEHYLAV